MDRRRGVTLAPNAVPEDYDNSIVDMDFADSDVDEDIRFPAEHEQVQNRTLIDPREFLT